MRYCVKVVAKTETSRTPRRASVAPRADSIRFEFIAAAAALYERPIAIARFVQLSRKSTSVRFACTRYN